MAEDLVEKEEVKARNLRTCVKGFQTVVIALRQSQDEPVG